MRSNIASFILFFTCATVVLFSCSSNISALPDKPASVEQVKKAVTGKKYTTKKTGFYGNLTVNDKTEIEWIDLKTEKDKTTIESAEGEQKFSVQFTNDSLATVTTKDSTFAAQYTVDDKVDEYDAVKEGIKLRLTYKDPSFSFGGQLSDVTYTYIVKGINEKALLLQLPKSVNRRPLISLLETQ